MNYIPDSLNHSIEPLYKRFKNKQIQEFQSVHLDCYGTTITDREAENILIEITQLLEEIIKINYIKNYE